MLHTPCGLGHLLHVSLLSHLLGLSLAALAALFLRRPADLLEFAAAAVVQAASSPLHQAFLQAVPSRGG